MNKDDFHASQLIKIGSNVRIDVSSIKEKLAPDIYKLILNNPEGRVIDYKLTDGMGIGVVVQFNKRNNAWFFLQEITLGENISNLEYNNLDSFKQIENAFTHSNNNNLVDMLNPINFIQWLFYSLKDVF